MYVGYITKQKEKNLHLFAGEITYSVNHAIFTILVECYNHVNCEICVGVYYQTKREKSSFVRR